MDGQPIYEPQSREIDTSVRWDHNPQGIPAPTGYYVNLKGVELGQVSDHAVLTYPNTARRQVGDVSVRSDQHPYMQVSATWRPPESGRRDGLNDPLFPGPPAPVLRMLGLFYAREQGSQRNTFENVPDGRRFPVNGSQDGVSWTYYQDARLAMSPADARGNAADSFSKLPPGPAHGWSSQPVINATAAELRKMRMIPQHQSPHQDRLANATAAGQSYSARTAHLSGPRQGTVNTWRPRG